MSAPNPRFIVLPTAVAGELFANPPESWRFFTVSGFNIAKGKRVDLTTFEFDILEMLMRSAGRVLSRDALMENFYNRKATPFDRSIDMHISHLRKKLEGGDDLIKTIRGVGYQFCRTPADVVNE